MAPPAAVTKSCSHGESVIVARYASNAATGTRMKVCSAFQIKSKAGILSAKNSTANSAPLAPITHQLASTSKPGGNAKIRACASSPRVATVAYRFSPAAKLVATTAATIWFAGIFVKTCGKKACDSEAWDSQGRANKGCDIRAMLGRLGYRAGKSKRPPVRRPLL